MINQEFPVAVVLLVDDDQELRGDMAQFFAKHGYETVQSGSIKEAIDQLSKRAFDAAVVDMKLPDGSGVELAPKILEENPFCAVVILTGEGSITTAVSAMKKGAADYLTKPIRMPELESVVRRSMDTLRLSKENQQLKQLLLSNQPPAGLVGESPAIKEVRHLIDRIGPTDKPVLVLGESGTGKELVVRAIHAQSPRRDRPLVVVNCAALPESLLESELFGYERGAFTGANTAKAGLFEVADGGTLFVDEIGELALSLQAKLLRTLEDGSFRRVGSTKERRANVRLLAATNRDLAEEVRKGRFRDDLFYRINVLAIRLPALRERLEDIPLLVRHFTGDQWELETGLMERLQSFDWPGNIRQLKNALERAKILATDRVLRFADFPQEINSQHPIAVPKGKPSTALSELAAQHVAAVFRKFGGNKTQTAQALGISRRALYRLLEKYQITKPNDVQST
jgi:DNA-binding NtrC family response regulator